MPDYEPADLPDPFIPQDKTHEDVIDPFTPLNRVEDPFKVNMPKGEPELLDVENKPEHKAEVMRLRKKMEEVVNKLRQMEKGKSFIPITDRTYASTYSNFLILHSLSKSLKTLKGEGGVVEIYGFNSTLNVSDPVVNPYELRLGIILDVKIREKIEQWVVENPQYGIIAYTDFLIDENGVIKKQIFIGKQLGPEIGVEPGNISYQPI